MAVRKTAYQARTHPRPFPGEALAHDGRLGSPPIDLGRSGLSDIGQIGKPCRNPLHLIGVVMCRSISVCQYVANWFPFDLTVTAIAIRPVLSPASWLVSS